MYNRQHDDSDDAPGWLGNMLRIVLRADNPTTRSGRPYTAEEQNYFWTAAQALPIELSEKLAAQLQHRIPSEELSKVISDWAGQRSFFTATGRLRANASFCQARNGLFQGIAADGAIMALWHLWRAGFKIVQFVHDQIVVEVLDDEHLPEQVQRIESLMVAGMAEVLVGMVVKVDGQVTRSLDKSELATT